MRNKQQSLLLLAGIALSGCIYVVQPRSPQVMTETPAPPVPLTDNYVPPPPQPTPVQYQPPPANVAPVYEDDLSPYGRWIVYGSYGRCWVPNNTPYGWQPYTVGHWVYADDGSCYWVSESDEVAWGGIVYHYGQWAFTADQGWIWVPGTTYAPAWVAWRDGGGYCGWAPLPPEACYGGDVSYVVADRYCSPQRFVFVQEGDINVTRVDQRVIRNNTTIINNTTNITNITVVNNRVVNHGVAIDQIQQRTGRQIKRVNVTDTSSPEQARRLAATGVPVRFSTPAIEAVHARNSPRADQVQPHRDPQPDRQRNAPGAQPPQQPNQAQIRTQQRQAQLNQERLENGENNRNAQFNRQPQADIPQPWQPAHQPADADHPPSRQPDRTAHSANEDKPKQKNKPKPGQDPEGGPPVK